ncbi:hypothetical protein [Aminobacter anthyllidis]|uniref:hypothetical protein n=1 Tax=Aminobacter anthyllidis TaxID=1035067 RepID=UPI001FECE548|nr:hypothetical protein [Aminobacter anthyllidis]
MVAVGGAARLEIYHGITGDAISCYLLPPFRRADVRIHAPAASTSTITGIF